MDSSLKEKAINLRKQGFSYSEILEQIPVAKSTLSSWLTSVNLSKKQEQRLTEKKLASIKIGARRMHELRMERWNKLKNDGEKEIKKLTRNEKWLIGISLYWAEGSKEKEVGSATGIKFSNSDPAMILLFKNWLKDFLKITDDKIKYELYIHEKADWKKASQFWSSKLKTPQKDIRVYFKPHNSNPKRKNIDENYKGLIRINVLGSIPLARKISGWTEGIVKNWGVVQW